MASRHGDARADPIHSQWDDEKSIGRSIFRASKHTIGADTAAADFGYHRFLAAIARGDSIRACGVGPFRGGVISPSRGVHHPLRFEGVNGGYAAS